MLDWRENFVDYRKQKVFYIYSDINASYCSIHQFLENGRGKPCVVANGNASGDGDAGACLAISYEARNRGIRRGFSLRRARSMVKDLVVYESCLPLYEVYAELFDRILECLVPASMCYRGSCDEVIIRFDATEIYVRPFADMVEASLAFLREELGERVGLKVSAAQRVDLEQRPLWQQCIYAISYLLRDAMYQILGLPLSIGIAPSISLSKSLVEVAKPLWSPNGNRYRTFHDAICFPVDEVEANQLFRPMALIDLCGVREIAKRFESRVGMRRVQDVQDHVSLDRSISIAQNLHLGKVIWYMCHGRDDVLSGYLAAVRDRK